jgi:hypothetical protein
MLARPSQSFPLNRQEERHQSFRAAYAIWSAHNAAGFPGRMWFPGSTYCISTIDCLRVAGPNGRHHMERGEYQLNQARVTYSADVP